MSLQSTQLPRVLFVDDELEVIEVYARLLEESYDVDTASDVALALEKMQAHPYDVVVTDICMPGLSGVDLSRIILERFPETEVMVITGNPEIETAVELIQLGIVDYLRKPFLCDALLAGIEKCLVRKRQRSTLVAMQRGARSARTLEPIGLGRLLGETREMQHLHTTVTRIQHVDTTVLILGETGSGKEMVARALHEGGHRREGPFLAINCAALSSELLEAELFGHCRGAFTGADRDRVGLIEQANGGTLLLDEVGEMSLELQAKLLRVIQEKLLRPVGGSSLKRVDVRFLAATHRDLQALVEEGTFRQDLFYRLNVYPIRVPALRQRPGDVALLAQHFLQELAASHQVVAPSLTEDALAELQVYSWPGNVRELRNLVERLLLVSKGSQVTWEDLQEAWSLDRNQGDETRHGSEPVEGFKNSEGRFLSLVQIETAYIRQVLEECDGNKTRAARIMGIHPSTIYRKLAA
jgi:DNA-binding NtrC family response regulator